MKCTNGGVGIETNGEQDEKRDELFQKAFDLLKEKDPSLLDDILKAASSDNKNLDFTIRVATRIHMFTALLDLSSEIRLYLKEIQIRLLYKSSEFYSKDAVSDKYGIKAYLEGA